MWAAALDLDIAKVGLAGALWALEVVRTESSPMGLCVRKAKGWANHVQVWGLRDVIRLSAPLHPATSGSASLGWPPSQGPPKTIGVPPIRSRNVGCSP